MRKLFSALLAGFGLLVATSASAGTVSMIWANGAGGVVSGIGTTSVEVSTTAVATLSLDVVLDIDTPNFTAGGIDIEFDTDLGNELNILSFTELGWTNAKASRSLLQITQGVVSSQESTGGAEGQVFGLEAFTLGSGPQNTTLTFARIVFTTNPANVSTDGFDVFETSERDNSLFVQSDGPGLVIELALPGPLAVNGGAPPFPEPGTLGLVGLGFGLLVAAGRRR